MLANNEKFKLMLQGKHHISGYLERSKNLCDKGHNYKGESIRYKSNGKCIACEYERKMRNRVDKMISTHKLRDRTALKTYEELQEKRRLAEELKEVF